MALTSAHFTDIGAFREFNQDSVFAEEKGDYGIYAVSDGMGGHSKGELASGKAVEIIGNWWKRNYVTLKNTSNDIIEKEIDLLIKRINTSIYQEYQSLGMIGGATLSLLIVLDTRYLMFTVGDSRVFGVTGKEVVQLSVDDVWENMQQNCSKDSEEIFADPRYGMLTQAIGFEQSVTVRVMSGSVQMQKFFFICSDGIYKYCPNKMLTKILLKAEKKKNLMETLMTIKKKVYDYGAEDNMTGILVRVSEK